MAKPTVYIETSVIGYLTSRLSGDLITAAHQKLTRVWWDQRRSKFALHISDFVLREISAGDPTAVQERLDVLGNDVAELPTPPQAAELARALIQQGAVPPKAAIDALHVAVAAIHGIDYLMTWNCRHIANATMRDRIAAVIQNRGYKPPVLCTPEELMGDNDD